ncbi:hypothetical protein D3C81_1871310 [compost metagenome]
MPHDINLPLQLHSKKILKGLKEICFHCIQILSLPLLLQLSHHLGSHQRTDAIAHITLAHIHHILHLFKRHRPVFKEHNSIQLPE